MSFPGGVQLFGFGGFDSLQTAVVLQGRHLGKGWDGGRGVSLVLKLLSVSTDKIAFLCIFKSKRLKIV